MLDNELILRLLAALAILSGGAALYWLGNRVILTRARQQVRSLESTRRGRPLLLYFSSPTCAPCHTVQRPTIQRLGELIGERLEIVEIDASQSPEVADRWGVLSVPTTLLIDSQGQPRYVNHGVAPLDKLAQQIRELFVN